MNILEEIDKTIQMTEIFNTMPEVDIKWSSAGMDRATTTLTKYGTSIYVKFDEYESNEYKTNFSMTERGTASAVEIFNAALLTVKEFIDKKKPNELAFIPFDSRRQNIYERMIKKNLDKSKWTVETQYLPFANVKAFMIKKKGK